MLDRLIKFIYNILFMDYTVEQLIGQLVPKVSEAIFGSWDDLMVAFRIHIHKANMKFDRLATLEKIMDPEKRVVSLFTDCYSANLLPILGTVILEMHPEVYRLIMTDNASILFVTMMDKIEKANICQSIQHVQPLKKLVIPSWLTTVQPPLKSLSINIPVRHNICVLQKSEI